MRAKRVNYRTNKKKWNEKERKVRELGKEDKWETVKKLWYSLHPCWDDKRGLSFYSETLLLPAHVFVLLIGIDERDQYEKRASLPHSQIRQPGMSLKHPESLRYASRQREIRPRGLCHPQWTTVYHVQRMNESFDVRMLNRIGCGFVVTNEMQ